jgi:hypothetical protein
VGIRLAIKFCEQIPVPWCEDAPFSVSCVVTRCVHDSWFDSSLNIRNDMPDGGVGRLCDEFGGEFTDPGGPQLPPARPATASSLPSARFPSRTVRQLVRVAQAAEADYRHHQASGP